MRDITPLDLRFQGWHKASYSQANGNSDCVEVGHSADAIGVRDTKNRASGTLVFGRRAWRALLAGLTGLDAR